MATKVFLHICAITRVLDVLPTMIHALHFSGLYQDAETIYCYICGEEALGRQVLELLARSGGKFKVTKYAPGDSTYERLTLTDMHNHVQADDKVLYLHSKGVSKKYQSMPRLQQNIDDWCYMMLYHLVGQHRQCREALDSVDVVGCNHCPSPAHFSGNFWWVRGSYLLSLPHTIEQQYTDPELKFLFLNQPRVKCVYTSTVNHYSSSYEPARYVDDAA